MSTGILLFAHGSPDPEWAHPFRAMLARVREVARTQPCELAFLDSDPKLDVGVDRLVAAGASTIVVAPLFLARGGHLKRDLPLLIAAASAKHGITITATAAIGESTLMIDAISAWALSQAGQVADQG